MTEQLPTPKKKYKKKNNQIESLKIFIDLDETLINTALFTKGNDKRTKVEIPDPEAKHGTEKYYTFMRPNALQLLEDCRSIAHTIMLTMSVRKYASAMNAAFGFGFEDKDIITRGQLYDAEMGAEKRTTARQCYAGTSVLIDNLDKRDMRARTKMAFLEISPYRYFKIREFYGLKDPPIFDEEWKEIIHTIKYIGRNNDSFGP